MNRTYKSTCSYCGVGCGIEVTLGRGGQLSVKGDPDHPGSLGMLCTKGMNLHHTVMKKDDRLLTPMMRASRGEAMQAVDWDTAMERAASEFREIIATHGPRAVALYVSGQMLTEEYYIANKLMKGFIGSNNIDTNSRLCMSSAVAGYKKSLGDDLVPNSYSDIEHCECFLVSGANPAWCHPILFRRLEAHKERNPDVRMIVMDPRRTQTCSVADLHLQIQPGTDVVVYNAIARELIEQGWIDMEFIAANTDGFEELREVAFGLTVEEAAMIAKVPAEDIRQAAEWIGESPTFISMWAMGLNQSAVGVDKNVALINLSLLTGKIGKPGCGPFSLTGQPNAMGGREVGGMANLLAAHRDLANPTHREEVQQFWGSGPIDPQPGHTAVEMFDAIERGEIKAVWVICTNPAVSLPNLNRIEKALRTAQFVVVQEISANADTVEFADLVLPAAGWLEKQGTMTNSERRITLLPMVVDAPGEARTDIAILCDFAKRMGWGEAFNYADESEIFDEYARLTKGMPTDISGLNYARLRAARSMQWPVPSADHPGTERLFEDGKFATENGRARLGGLPYVGPLQGPDELLPLVLTTGRIRDQWHTMTRTGKVGRLKQHIARPFLEMHPIDADARGVADGETVTVRSGFGEVQLPLKVTDEIKQGVVFAPMHWGKQLQGGAGRANLLTSSRFDPVSKEPDFKYCTVEVERIVRPARRVLVVGAGAAALEFVRTYRKFNKTDELHVFGREPLMFYNRVLLIEYIGGRKSWDELLTCDEATLEDLGVTLHCGVEVTEIDRETKKIRTDAGKSYDYDTLLLGTGSRPFVPPGIPMDKEGMFSIRSRKDAEAIMATMKAGSRVVVLGGGLLGLEMVGELLHLDVEVTVINNTPTLMGRQLDDTGAEILKEILEDRGAEVICNDIVVDYIGETRIEAVRTKGGRFFECDLMIVACGVAPNIDLAKAAGLECGRGVKVDDHMLTSDPHIYAAGEIAEHRGFLYGTTPSANDQARVVAAHLAGDLWAAYEGSTLFNILKVPGLDLASIGFTNPPDDDPSYEDIVLMDRRRHYYKRCVMRNNVLVGAILIGDQSEFASLKQLITDGTELDEKRDELLRSKGGGAGSVDGPLVCSCHTVGRGNLEKLIVAEGLTELETVCERSKAGTGCGSCRPEIKALLAELGRDKCSVGVGDDLRVEAV